MARTQRDLGLERQWRERVAGWQASGVSVREFCRRRGLTETSFYDWKRELRTRDAQAGTSSSRTPVARRASEGKTSPTAFVPLTVISQGRIIQLVANTTTPQGLKIKAELDRREYPTGTKVTPQQLAAVRLKPASFHGEWNYSILPNGTKK